MAGYQSEQSKLLMSFLRRHSETPMTIEEISEQIHTEEKTKNAPGTSTVYRLVKKAVAEGKVKRFVSGNSRKVVYQFASREDCHAHLHLKCSACGKLLHMENSDTSQMMSQILRQADFTIDTGATVLFGICGSCPAGERKRG